MRTIWKHLFDVPADPIAGPIAVVVVPAGPTSRPIHAGVDPMGLIAVWVEHDVNDDATELVDSSRTLRVTLHGTGHPVPSPHPDVTHVASFTHQGLVLHAYAVSI